MAGFLHYLKENLKKNEAELKALTKRDLFRKSEFSTLPRLAAYAGAAAGFVGYFFVPFAAVATAIVLSMAGGFAYGALKKEPKQRLEYTAIGSIAPFALPGAIAGGIVAGLQLSVMFAAKSIINIRDAVKSATADRAKEKPAEKKETAATPAPAPESAPAPQPAPAAPEFNVAATENKPAVAPAPAMLPLVPTAPAPSK